MSQISISAISLNTTPLDFAGNLSKIQAAILHPKSKDTDLFLFPELCLSGYGCEDAFYLPKTWENSWSSLKSLLPLRPESILVVGLPFFWNSYLYNCMAVLYQKRVIALVPKIHLANTGVHYEKRWFQSSQSFLDQTFEADGEAIPFGHFIFDWKNTRFAIEICEDSWVSTKPSSLYLRAGLEILLSPGASHFAMGKSQIRKQIFAEASRNQANLHVFTNLVGNESGRLIFDGGSLFYSLGNLVLEGPRLSFTDYQISTYNFETKRSQFGKAKSVRNDWRPTETSIPVLYLPEPSEQNQQRYPKLVDKRPVEAEKPSANLSVYEEFTKAVALGLWDYNKKSKSQGFTLSLSGGADSTSCAFLVFIMKNLAKSELGDDTFSKNQILEENLLYLLYQKTKNNSSITESIAEQVAQDVNYPYASISIDEFVDNSLNIIGKVLHENLTWQTHDLALQNIQARVRSPLVWLIANVKNHLLLSTGNRSESSVGYTTMDGDSSGSLCPLAGVSKQFLLLWISDIQSGNNRFLPPQKSLDLLLHTKPSAELKPLSENQEDEKDLMPYPILQSIEAKFISEGMDKQEILKGLQIENADTNEATLKNYVETYFRLFVRSQWKRERLAPSFHLDEYGLDPKSSFRFPILSKFEP